MSRYEVEILGVGSCPAPSTPTPEYECWSVNAVLGFKSLKSCLSFFEDPSYQMIKSQHRDQAYQILNLYLFKVDYPNVDIGSQYLNEQFTNAQELEVFLHSNEDQKGWVSGLGIDTPHTTPELVKRYRRASIRSVSPLTSTQARRHDDRATRSYRFIPRTPHISH